MRGVVFPEKVCHEGWDLTWFAASILLRFKLILGDADGPSEADGTQFIPSALSVDRLGVETQEAGALLDGEVRRHLYLFI